MPTGDRPDGLKLVEEQKPTDRAPMGKGHGMSQVYQESEALKMEAGDEKPMEALFS